MSKKTTPRNHSEEMFDKHMKTVLLDDYIDYYINDDRYYVSKYRHCGTLVERARTLFEQEDSIVGRPYRRSISGN